MSATVTMSSSVKNDLKAYVTNYIDKDELQIQVFSCLWLTFPNKRLSRTHYDVVIIPFLGFVL